MFNLSPKSSYPFSNKGIQVNSLRFIPSHGSNYISIYAQYSNCKDWVPISIGLSAVPSLQQVRDIDRNISLNTGSYENAHFYLRSADGNNVTTAFFTNKDGGAIQSGTTTGLTALNLQPLGGVLNYGTSEVASQKWTREQGYLKTETDPVYTSAIPNILMYKGNIGASVDLNTYTITGVYVQSANASAANGINYPVAFAGKLEVVNQTGTFVWQIYHVYGDNNAANRGIWRREYYGGIWYPWAKLIDTGSTGIYELIANKATTFATINNTLYPTTQAVANKFYNGTPVAITQNQFYGLTDGNAYDMSPANNDWTWHDAFAFNASRYQYETTTDFGTTWTANGVGATAFKLLTQQKQSVGAVTLTNTSGVPNGIRCTFLGLAFSNIGHIMLHMLYSSPVCNIDVIIESSPDNTIWTLLFTRANNALNNSAAGNVFRLNTSPVTTYIRITIVVNTASVAGSTAVFTALRGMALRGGAQGFGKEYEYPYNWTEDKYMRFTVPTYTGTGVLPTQYKLALLDTNNGNQLTMTDLGSALNGSFIQNQSVIQTGANFNISGNAHIQGGFIKDLVGATQLPVKIIKFPMGGVYSDTTTSPVGAYVISHPEVTSTMLTLTIKMVDYNTSADPITIKVFSYSINGTSFTNNKSVLIEGDNRFNNLVRLAYDASGNRCVVIGDVATTYTSGYIRVYIEEATMTYSGASNPLWNTGWNISLVTDLSAYTGLTNLTVKKTVTDSGSSSSFIQNQTATLQTANARVNGFLQAGKMYIGTGAGPGASVNVVTDAPITGGPNAYSVRISSTIQSDVTNAAFGYSSNLNTQAAAFTIPFLRHFYAQQGTVGAGSAITNQVGFMAEASLVGGSFNVGFQGVLPANGTSNYNLYMNGTAPNYLAGRLGMNATALTNVTFRNSLGISGNPSSYGAFFDTQIASDVTSSATIYASSPYTAAAAFTLGTLTHFGALQGTIGAGSTVTTQQAFLASSNMIGATNNYGFRGQIPSGASNWNLYMDGSANNFLASRLGIGTTSLSNSIVHITSPVTGSATMYTHLIESRAASDVTSSMYGYVTSIGVLDGFTMANMIHYYAQQGTFGTATVTTQTGFNVSANMIGGTLSNYGFRGLIPAGTGRWNVYMDGTAQNFFAGNVSIGVNTSSTNILNVNAGTVAGATVLGNFSQNGGSIQLQNGTAVAVQFTPVLKGVAVGNNGYGLGLIAQGFDAYSQAGIVLSARNISGNNIVTSGKILSVQNYTTEYFSVNYQGVIAVSNLAGTGTRVVTADALGNLGSVALTSGTVTNVTGTANRVTVTNGTTTPVIDIATTYVGQTSITTLGTITTGAWNGAVIGTSYGGTGTSGLTGLVVGNGASQMAAIAGTANQLLRRNPANTAYEFFTPTYLTATPNLQAVAMAGNAFLGDLILGNVPGFAVSIGSGPGGTGNTRVGTNALNSNVNGDWNVAIGCNSLSVLTTSVNNTAIGENTGTAYTGVGSIGNNTWVGNSAGQGMTGGTDNLLVGALAGYVGATDRNRGDGNIMIGRNAGNSIGTSGTGALGSYNVFMGYNAGLGSTYGLLSNRLVIGNVLNTGVDLPIIEGNMTVGAAALTVNASFKATGAAFLMSGTNTNSILPATGTDLDIQNNNGNTNIYGVVHLKATPASSGEEMLIVDTTGKIGTAAIPGFNPPAGVTLTSSTNIIVSEVSACTDKYGRVRITTSASSPQYDVVVFIKYSVPYNVDAKATINYANGEIATSMMVGGSNFYYIMDNDASGFHVFFKEIPSKVTFMIDYNVVGY